MSYTVLARRYRSRDFDELVGQDVVADTLRRAVEQDRVAHAYLFCGTRGVGKTSMARILARALNAVDTLGDTQGVGDAIMRGDDLDVIEIDGASNRGVEQARELIAAAGLSPARCPYRIYIIDEVHMLTSEAFNTLLKTMEEPPSHVKFILCTTEPHKVPATIRSRCQRFDFKPIAMSDIVGHLQHVVDTEGVKVEAGVLDRVAALGQGSMRDALSVLERLLAAGDASIDMDTVEATLGLPPTALVHGIIDAVLDGAADAALQQAHALQQQGIALDQVIEALVETNRELMLMCTCGVDTELIDAGETQREALAQRAQRGRPDVFAHAVAVFEAVARQSAMAASAGALFDAALVRLALASSVEDDTRTDAQQSAPVAAKKKRPTARPEPPVKPAAVTPAAAKPAPKKKAPEVSAKVEAPPPAAALSMTESWATFCSSLESRALQVAAEMLTPTAMDNGTIHLDVDGSSIVVEDKLEQLQAAAAGILGSGTTLVLNSSTLATPPPSASASLSQAGADPLVKMVSEVFDAEVVQVKASSASAPQHTQERTQDV